MNKTWIVALALVGSMACKQDPPADKPAETAAQTATQTAAQEAAKPEVGAEYVGLDGDAKAAILAKGDVAKSRELLTFELFQYGNAVRDGQVGPVEIGGQKFDKPMMVGLRQTRLIVVRAAAAPNDCEVACQNAHLNKAFEPVTQLQLFKDDANLDGAALQKLIDAFWVGPQDTVLGISGATLYQVFRPVVHEYAHVLKALKAMGDAPTTEFKAELATAGDDPKVMPTFYKRFVNMNDIAGKSGLEKSSRLAIASGFWMRRMADGTAPVLEDALRKTLDAYDKPLRDAVFPVQ